MLKSIIFTLLLFCSISLSAQQINSSNGQNLTKPASQCDDVNSHSNGECFDFQPAMPIVLKIREILGHDVFVHIISLIEVELFTNDVGLSANEIREKIGATTLPNGRRLIDIIFVIDGDIPDDLHQVENPNQF
ncbi:MAG: hypothetical protein CMQ38_12660 [Gammaproteobacteria bacterium]|nr:hypothetical protein [Gammaproteobacteria bacterium]|tara:strand:- start:18010 stop:18408 length:399 start_codon:yes stop_codon:yes gene_type:complete